MNSRRLRQHAQGLPLPVPDGVAALREEGAHELPPPTFLTQKLSQTGNHLQMESAFSPKQSHWVCKPSEGKAAGQQ